VRYAAAALVETGAGEAGDLAGFSSASSSGRPLVAMHLDEAAVVFTRAGSAAPMARWKPSDRPR
jgi:hypothetical protein